MGQRVMVLPRGRRYTLNGIELRAMDAKAAGDLDLTRRRVDQSDKDRHWPRPVVTRLGQANHRA
jgi:hypothetical protein